MNWEQFQLPYSRLTWWENQICHPLQNDLITSVKRRESKALYQLLNLTTHLAMKVMLIIPSQMVIAKTVMMLILNMLMESTKKMCKDMLYVTVEGCLLQGVVWEKQSTYRKIIQIYINYVESHYGKSGLVFDRYQDGLSTKDHEHAQRTMKSKNFPNAPAHWLMISPNKHFWPTVTTKNVSLNC